MRLVARNRFSPSQARSADLTACAEGVLAGCRWQPAFTVWVGLAAARLRPTLPIPPKGGHAAWSMVPDLAGE